MEHQDQITQHADYTVNIFRDVVQLYIKILQTDAAGLPGNLLWRGEFGSRVFRGSTLPLECALRGNKRLKYPKHVMEEVTASNTSGSGRCLLLNFVAEKVQKKNM